MSSRIMCNNIWNYVRLVCDVMARGEKPGKLPKRFFFFFSLDTFLEASFQAVSSLTFVHHLTYRLRGNVTFFVPKRKLPVGTRATPANK